MNDDLVKRLQMWAHECEEQHGPGMWSQDMRLSADRIEALRARVLLLEGYLAGALDVVEGFTHADTTDARKVLERQP